MHINIIVFLFVKVFPSSLLIYSLLLILMLYLPNSPNL
uniref:Uncharacterized protein n=1 Tax=Rhizophora mucronata TaxID=61149 RepID=A0A2P2PW54_RHIMU